MLQSWNKFCFTSGYIEVSLSLPGPNEETQGYWPGVWTMGNLGRPGYGATTDGTWPYSYDACDVGTFPNQTWSNHSGPAAALHTDQGRAKYNFELSWLAGQKLSACTCPGEDHPGPDVSKGRGAPEIDVLEAQKNKLGPGAKVSQSAQFAPFSHDYVYDNTTATSFNIFNAAITQANTYHGSAVQQAVSGLTDLPPSIFNGTGGQFSTFGFEYWANPKNRPEGYIEWQVGGTPSLYMSAAAVTADQGVGGSGVSDRLIPEEPMSIVLNLAISESFQNVDLTSMTFPAELLIDYVRVYQRDGHENVGCNPKDYPTTDYINRHLDAYTNANLTGWNTGTSAGTAGAGYSFPKNSMFSFTYNPRTRGLISSPSPRTQPPPTLHPTVVAPYPVIIFPYNESQSSHHLIHPPPCTRPLHPYHPHHPPLHLSPPRLRKHQHTCSATLSLPLRSNVTNHLSSRTLLQFGALGAKQASV
ncbi:SKN1-domain-containing protein [Rickenella mellea]|uniref:SKN1-domain-containing protein n=1 Tax=Rickenella mellea TaxID=50990 RepID=A0A4Y7PVS0_9AGAM|nr:SKN1-domain-containing protein [Rickenella mellea]